MKTLAYPAWFAGATALAFAENQSQASTRPGTSGMNDSGPFKLRYIIAGSVSPAIVVGSALYYQRAFSVNLRTQLRISDLDRDVKSLAVGA